MKKLIALCFCLCLTAITAHAQQAITLSGRIVQAEDEAALAGVNIILTSLADTTRHVGAISDDSGFFRIIVAARGAYRLRFSYVGFQTLEQRVRIPPRGRDIGVIRMEKATLPLDQITVEARHREPRRSQRLPQELPLPRLPGTSERRWLPG